MRKFSTLLSILATSGVFIAGTALAQDDVAPENTEPAPEEAPAEEVAAEAGDSAVEAVAEAADAPAAAGEAGEAVADNAGEAVADNADGAETQKGGKTQNAVPERDAVESYRYFIELLRACGNDPAYQQRADKKACDVEALWDAIDAQSKTLFVNAYASLVRVDRIIETYFDPIEYKHMRSRTGTNIIKDNNVTDALELFKYIFKPQSLVFNEATLSGVEYERMVNHSANMVTIITHSQGQNFVMVRESDKVWRNAGLITVFEAAVNPIFESEKAMQEYAKDNLLAEIDRRKKVLSYYLLQRDMLRIRAK